MSGQEHARSRGKADRGPKGCALEFLNSSLAAPLLIASPFLVRAQSSLAVFHDFCRLPPHSQGACQFIIQNPNETALRVSGARPSCECMHVISTPKEIPAHGAAPVVLEVATGGPGVAEWTLSLEIAGEGSPRLCGLSAVVTGQTNWAVAPGLLAKPGELMAPQAAPAELVLVDTRSPAQFRVARIPGSWNLALYTLKTRAYLKGKRVVLFNEGHDPTLLLGECQRLRDLGFARAQVLEGRPAGVAAGGGTGGGGGCAAGGIGANHSGAVLWQPGVGQLAGPSAGLVGGGRPR